MKSWVRHFIYLILLVISISLLVYIGKLSSYYFNIEFRPNYLYFILSFLISICIGFLLGMEQFLKEFRKNGRWQIRLPKLILITLPAFYLSLTNLLVLSNNYFLSKIIGTPLIYMFQTGAGAYVHLFQIILGFTLITSFYKNEKTSPNTY